MDVLPRGSQKCPSDRLRPHFPPGRQQFRYLPGDCCPLCRTQVEVPFLSQAPIGVLFLALSCGRALAEHKRLFSLRGACTNISTRLRTAASWGGLAACASVAIPLTRWLGKPQPPRPRGGRSTAGWMFQGSFLPPLRPELINHFYTAWKGGSKCVADAKGSFRELPAS